MKRFFILIEYLSCLSVMNLLASPLEEKVLSLWNIGDVNYSASDLALGPDQYQQFLANDFGYEDRYFLIGKSNPKEDFPYLLPGPADAWGGTGSTSGWRTHEVNILFGLSSKMQSDKSDLIINIIGTASQNPPLLKISINGQMEERIRLQVGHNDSLLVGDVQSCIPQKIVIPIAPNILREGGNCVTLSVLEGSWVVFDAISMESPIGTTLIEPSSIFLREIKAASYELEYDGSRFQPLLIDVEHLDGHPKLSVELDGTQIYTGIIDSARYIIEALMPAVASLRTSAYTVKVNEKIIQKGFVKRAPSPLQTVADYVDTRIGTAHSRWMIAPGPWMPFSMVKLSPDNQNKGWQAGYQPTFESLGCFSHIHEWTMAGLGMMPTNGALQTSVGDELEPESGYRSRIDKSSEEASVGYYKVKLTDYDILAELTATTRCSFQRYTFPQNRDSARVLIDLHIPAEYDYRLVDAEVKKVSDTRIEGFCHQLSPNVWSHDADQDYTLHFVIEFDHPIQMMGVWRNAEQYQSDSLLIHDVKNAGVWAQFDAAQFPVVQIRAGLSLVSIENAALNLEKEVTLPFGWDFTAVRANQKNVWNNLLSRVMITTSNRQEKVRFYSNMYRALCSRNTWSDVNGEWISADGKTRTLSSPDDVALGCDAFWNTFWNLNQFWNLVVPEWSSRWVRSQLAMYDATGWLAKGPAGMKYIPVMVAEHEIPLLTSTYQMGIRNYDAQKLLDAVKKMQTTPSQKIYSGYAGNRDLHSYLKYHYVPSDLGRFSNSLEYAFDDWAVSQLALALKKDADYKTFSERGMWWRNTINSQTGYAQLRNSKGEWKPDFDPFRSGANQQYVEGNAWQLTYFVPQDVPALAKLIGEDRFTERLMWGFSASEPWRYNAPGDQYWDFPVVQGNQQSMHFAFLFNWVGKPWLTQRWSRSIVERYYGSGVANAYLGDEDQGQMSAWFIMAALGLFQTDGGCRVKPIYEIASPLYEKIVIDLGKRFGRGRTFIIEAKNTSRTNIYVQSAELNGKPLRSFSFPASELLQGGSLILQMGAEPNESWGVDSSLF